MSYFVAGGGVAACCHPGIAQTDLFTVNQKGALCALTVQGNAFWGSPFPLTPTGLAKPGAFLAASPDFGAPLPGVAVFLVDALGTLQLFTQTAPRFSWRNQILGAPGQFVAGSGTFAVLPGTLRDTDIVNQLNVLLVDHAGTLHWHHRDADQVWQLDTSINLGAAASNANIAGLARYANSQVAQELRLFFVDSNGVLNCLTNSFANGWSSSVIPTGAIQLNPGTRLAASVRFGTSPTSDFDDPNVFAVDSDGNLVCFSLGASGVWQATTLTHALRSRKGVKRFAAAGSPVAASRQYLDHAGSPFQTDVFVVGLDGSLNVFSSQDGAAWSANPTVIAPNVAGPNTILAVAPQAGLAPPRQSDPDQSFSVRHPSEADRLPRH